MRIMLQNKRGGADSTAETMVSVSTQTPWSYLNDIRQHHNVTDSQLVLDDGCDIEEKTSQLQKQSVNTPVDDEESEEHPHDDSSESVVDRTQLEDSHVSEVVEQLSQLQFISSEEEEKEEEEKDEGEEEKDEGEEEKEEEGVSGMNDDDDAALPPYPTISSSQLSWPAILQYLRESESEASKYFSLDNTDNISDVKRSECLAGEDEMMKHEEDAALVEKMNEVCDFCGQSTTQWSVLNATTAPAEPVLSDACCWRFKEYCLLVAACLRQLIANRISSKPTLISVELKHKKDLKKVAEDRAYAMMRRRKRWEEKRQRKQIGKNKTLQSSSFYSLTKQTKTIQFSLLSSTVMKTGWMMDDNQASRVRGRKEENKKKRKKKDENKLPNHVLNMLKRTIPLPQALDVRTYHDGRPFCTLLPDHTGQYYYPSGSIAIMIYTHIPGLLTYVIFNDTGSEVHHVMGYSDELGRLSCCYPTPDSSFRLHVSVCGDGVMYTVRGDVIKQWTWNKRDREMDTESRQFQPLSLSLNHNILLQCTSRQQMVITFSTNQLITKITIPRKLKETIDNHNDNTDSSWTQYLIHLQSRLKYLLTAISKVKIGRFTTNMELEPITRRSHHRPRSYSTGTLSLSKHPSNNGRLI